MRAIDKTTGVFYNSSMSFMKEQKAKIALGSLTFFLGLFYMLAFSNTPLMQPDSLSYINFSPVRPLGYPLFLWTLKTLTGSYKMVPYLQLSFYFAAIFYCGLNFYKLSQSLLLSLGLILGISVNVAFIKLFSSLLTDVVGGGCLLFFLGSLFSFLHHPRLKTIYSLWIVIGVACLIRPVFYCLVGVLPILYLINGRFFRENMGQRLLFPTLPFLFLLSIGSVGQYINHGFFKTESFLGNNLIGKVSLIAEPSIPSQYPSFMHSFGQNSAKIRYILDKAPSLRVRYLLSVPYYDVVRFSFLPSLLPPKDSDSFSKHIALEVIKEKPSEYAKDVLMNYRALWQLWDFYSFEEGKEFDTLLHSLSSPALDNMYASSSIRGDVNRKFGHPFLVQGIRTVLGFTFILSLFFPLAFFVLWIQGKSLSLLGLGGMLSSITIQSGYILTALLQAGIARYALLFWPCISILLAVSLKLILNNLKLK